MGVPDYNEFATGRFAWYVTPIGVGGAVASVTILPTSGSVFTPISKAIIHNQAQPAANTNIFGADLTPTNTPCNFRIQVLMSNAGNFSVAITNGGNTQVGLLNAVPGPALVAGAIYIFDVLVHAGDSINFRYSNTGGIIQILRVQEIDASTS